MRRWWWGGATLQPNRDEALKVLELQVRRQLRILFPAAPDGDIAWALGDVAKRALIQALVTVGRVDGPSSAWDGGRLWVGAQVV